MKYLPFGLMIVGGILLALPERLRPAPPQSSSEVQQAFDREAELLTTAITGCIERLRSGQLTTDAATRDWLQKASTEAHNQAWRPVAERDKKALEVWSVEAHVKRLQEMVGDE